MTDRERGCRMIALFIFLWGGEASKVRAYLWLSIHQKASQKVFRYASADEGKGDCVRMGEQTAEQQQKYQGPKICWRGVVVEQPRYQHRGGIRYNRGQLRCARGYKLLNLIRWSSFQNSTLVRFCRFALLIFWDRSLEYTRSYTGCESNNLFTTIFA